MIEETQEILKELLEEYVAENREEFLTEVSGSNHYSLWFSEQNMKVVAATMVSDNWSDQTRDICLFRKRSGYLEWDIDNDLSFRENLEEMLDDGELEDFIYENLAERDLEEHVENFGEELLHRIFQVYTTDKGELIMILQDKVLLAWENAEIDWDVLKEEKHDEELNNQLFGNVNNWNYQDVEAIRTVCLMDQAEIEKLCRFAKIAQDIEDNEEQIKTLENVLTPAEAEIIVLRECNNSFLSIAEYKKVTTQALRNGHSVAIRKIKQHEHIANDPEPFPS